MKKALHLLIFTNFITISITRQDPKNYSDAEMRGLVKFFASFTLKVKKEQNS